ncbi:MAG: phosphodiester glycosidase family protein, partial [Oscillospiraceae bacterium]|nr:phosphodiester glycosidase family protein [Oscillospiraceae bacterium]
MRKNHHVFRSAFLCALTVFSVYVLLDTFVIVRRIETSAEARTDSEPAGYAQTGQAAVTAQLSAAAEAAPDPEPVRTEDTYRDENIRVTVTEERVSGTTVYAADVELSSAEYLKTAFAENTYGRNVTDKTSSIAESVNAILAVNGDFYGSRQSGYVIRGGT